jgi:beta-galactosidase
MSGLSRRDLFLSGAVATVAGATLSGKAEAAHRRRAPARKPAKSEAAAPVQLKVRERLLFDFGWRFHLGHASDMARDFNFGADLKTFAKAGANVAAAAGIEFDDSGWAKVDLPHDWAMELPFAPSKNPPPAPAEDPGAAHGYKPLGRDFPETSIGWYRRSFEVPASDLGRRIVVEFDGVFRDAQVMINGYLVARNQSGYAPFRVDLTDFVEYGGRNVLCVRVDATLGEGWFYEGAGIYRHVWLVKTDPLHIPQWGSWVKSEVRGASAALSVTTELRNNGLHPRTCQIVSQILDPAGKIVAVQRSQPMAIGALQTRVAVQRIFLRSPALWSLETPQLYQLVTNVTEAGRAVDDNVVSFGIRTARFDPDKGFLLNGKPVKLNGTCNHQDHAGVGAAVPDRLQAWRIEGLKEFGCNAYRMSHNPPAPELLDACDRAGMLVIDETRRMSSDPDSMDELTRMIRRDRNHPSIILWSIGNEEPQQGTERGARVAASMKALCSELDPTRPICAAIDNPDAWERGFSPLLDVLGANYRTGKIPAFHARNPKKPMIGTETGSTVATRGIYIRDPASGYSVAYDTEHPWWANTAEEWMQVVAPAPYIAGGFVWTGFDYHGEPTPFNRWPNVMSQFGILDLCGFPKDNFYYYKAWWGDGPVLHLFPHWNWRPGQKVNIWCHSNLDRVELFLNGESLGVRDVPRLGHVEWDAEFESGVIEARGYRNGQLALTDRRETTGAPAQVMLFVDQTKLKADGEDLCVAIAEIQDAQGRRVPDAANAVTFNLSGPGKIIGVGNGDPRSHEPEKANIRSTFNGLCMAIVQAGKQEGDIWLEATSPGLQPNKNCISTLPAKLRPYVE